MAFPAVSAAHSFLDFDDVGGTSLFQLIWFQARCGAPFPKSGALLPQYCQECAWLGSPRALSNYCTLLLNFCNLHSVGNICWCVIFSCQKPTLDISSLVQSPFPWSMTLFPDIQSSVLSCLGVGCTTKLNAFLSGSTICRCWSRGVAAPHATWRDLVMEQTEHKDKDKHSSMLSSLVHKKSTVYLCQVCIIP